MFLERVHWRVKGETDVEKVQAEDLRAAQRRDLLNEKSKTQKQFGSKASGLAGGLSEAFDEDSELSGRSKSDKAFNRKRVDNAEGVIGDILKDNEITEKEYAPFIQALNVMKQAVAAGNDEAINTINSLLEVATTQNNRVENLSREIEKLKQVIISQGAGT